MKEGLKEFLKKHQVMVLVIIFFILIGLLLFGTQIYLFFNFLLGNDIIVNVQASKESVHLKHGEMEKVFFETGVTTNPFCKASCTSEFKDLSRDEVLEKEQFMITPGKDKQQAFTIRAKEKKVGYSLYQFLLQCQSVESTFCHTDEQPTSRSILVTVFTNVTEAEKEVQEQILRNVSEIVEKITMAQNQQRMLINVSKMLEKSFMLNETEKSIENTERLLQNEKERLLAVQQSWRAGNIWVTQQQVAEITVDDITQEQLKIMSEIEQLMNEYSNVSGQFYQSEQILQNLTTKPIRNATVLLLMQKAVTLHNLTRNFLLQKNTLDEKKNIVQEFTKTIEEIQPKVLAEEKVIALDLGLQADIRLDTLCLIGGICAVHPTVADRAKGKNNSFSESCTELEKVKSGLSPLNQTFTTAGYPTGEEFWQNMSLKVQNKQQELILSYLEQVPEEENETMLLKTLLVPKEIMPVEGYPDYNLTAALITVLRTQPLPSCSGLQNHSLTLVMEALPSYVLPQVAGNSTFTFSLGEQEQECCVLGKCDACCQSGECEQEELYPIIFLHGHAFNKDISAEYSLDAFNTLQDKLEQEGYVNGGAISLYTTKNTPMGEWGVFKTPMTLKVSYYYDIFQTPENYVIVQEKSESIDTYAVRFKEILDTVRYKTGRDKVVVVAHSMGGLVARRYVQIFGSDQIAKLVTVGTPHQGITEETFKQCNVIGEERECRDMKEDSVFMSKLKNSGILPIPVYTIAGSGCEMPGGDGDGVVLLEKAVVAEGKKYTIEGECDGLDLLHTKLLDIEKYPQVYQIIMKVLED